LRYLQGEGERNERGRKEGERRRKENNHGHMRRKSIWKEHENIA